MLHAVQEYGCFNNSVLDSHAFLYNGKYSLWSCPTDASQGDAHVGHSSIAFELCVALGWLLCMRLAICTFIHSYLLQHPASLSSAPMLGLECGHVGPFAGKTPYTTVAVLQIQCHRELRVNTQHCLTTVPPPHSRTLTQHGHIS